MTSTPRTRTDVPVSGRVAGMRKLLLPCAVLLALLALPAVASAHPERTTFFPDFTKAERPKFRTTGTILTVCRPDSKARINAMWKGRGPKTSRKRRLRIRQLKRCRFQTIQGAVDAAKSNTRI